MLSKGYYYGELRKYENRHHRAGFYFQLLGGWRKRNPMTPLSLPFLLGLIY